MKKYNLSSIMKNAWAIRRMTGCTMSEALRKSWENAKAPKDIVSNLLSAGGRRWTKNGKDRIYLSGAIGTDLDMTTDDAPCAFGCTSMSRSVRNIIEKIVDGAYYDVVAGKLVYTRTSYSWANNHVENRFNAIAA